MKITKLKEDLENMKNIEDAQTIMPPAMGDAVKVSKQKEKNFQDVTKKADEPFTGVTKKEVLPEEPEVPEVNAQLDESLFEDIADGWELEQSDLSYVLEKLERVKYEIDNCVRGAYTDVATYPELANLIDSLAEELSESADALREIDESLNEAFEYANGSLEDFDPSELMDKVKERQSALFTDRVFGGSLYSIHFSPHGRVDNPDSIWVDIIKEEEDGRQERVFMKRFDTYDDAILAVEKWKDVLIEGAIEEALNEDGRSHREILSDKEKEREKEEMEDPWSLVYNELEKETGPERKYNIVNLPTRLRFNSDDMATDYDGNLLVYAPNAERLDVVKQVADAYKLPCTVQAYPTIRDPQKKFVAKITMPQSDLVR